MMKKIAASALALSVAAPAFAYNVNATLSAALTELDAAYDALEGTESQATKDALDSLLYHADNHGTVSEITYSAGEFVDGVWTPGALSITNHDFTTAIAQDVIDLKDAISNDIFGGAGRDRTDVIVAETNNNWDVSGVSGSILETYLEDATAGSEGLVTQLNSLESAIAAADAGGYTESLLQDVSNAADDVKVAGDDTNEALDKVDLAQAESWAGTDREYAIRTTDEAEMDINGPDGVAVTVEAHINASDSFSVGTDFTGNYSDYVDSFLD